MNYWIHRLLMAGLGFLGMLLHGVSLLAVEVADTRQSPHAVLLPVQLNEVQWTDGFWADRLQTLRTRSIPAMWEIMKGTRYKPFYQNFLIAAGEAKGDFHGAQWND